jgi:hypothetical protein
MTGMVVPFQFFYVGDVRLISGMKKPAWVWRVFMVL